MSRQNWTDEKLLHRLLHNKSKVTYWDNVNELRTRANATTFKECVKLTKSSIPTERVLALDIIAQFGIASRPFGKASRVLFFKLLKKEKHPKVLFAALHAIGHNNQHLTAQQVQLLASFKSHQDAGVRAGLVSALSTVNSQLAIDTLIHLSGDRISHIRDWATFGIGTLSERNNNAIREALWLRVDDSDQNTRFEAIVGLAKRKDQRVYAIIQRELMKEDYGSLLFEAIIEMDDKAALPALKKQLVKATRKKTTNLAWLEDLKACIQKLQE